MADKFFIVFNGRYFSEQNQENIHAVFISRIEYHYQTAEFTLKLKEREMS